MALVCTPKTTQIWLFTELHSTPSYPQRHNMVAGSLQNR